MRALAPVLLCVGASACGASPVALHAPECAPAAARAAPTQVQVEPMQTSPKSRIASPVAFLPPDPAPVLTSALSSELGGRALHGGEPGGYVARCSLDRFAIRSHANLSATHALTVLYVDLGCEVMRALDRKRVFRGELRGRAATTSATLFAGDAGSMETRANRMLSDAAREMASDLAVRALGLEGTPSARVFPNEDASQRLAGIDDTPLGASALGESPASVVGALAALRNGDTATRAAGWNVAAMAAGPGDPWLAGPSLILDDDPYVRFYQYKALARSGTAEGLAELRRALGEEEEALLAEFIGDSLASSGIGLARRPGSVVPPASASPATSGSTTRP